jgi:tRNA (cmo5U34)-methyltransferase
MLFVLLIRDPNVLARAKPGWIFDGVEPSAEMLKPAERTLGPLASRARLHQGYIDEAPEGPFDAATCLLTLHFRASRRAATHSSGSSPRPKPGAPFVVAHFSFPQRENERELWLSRYPAFLIASGVEPKNPASARTAIDTQLNILTPEQD